MRSRTTRDSSRRNSYSPSYSRSPSPYTRTSVRTRSPSYSDSFESEDDMPKRTPRRPAINPPPKAPSVVSTVASITGGKRNAKKGGGKDKPGKVTPRMLDVVARRMLSAKRVKMNDLRNEVEIMKRQIEQLTKENKFLQLQSRRQEKELTKADSANSELPALLERHNQEMRAVKEHLRRVKEKYGDSQKRNKELDSSLTRVTNHLQKLKELTEDKHLQDREVLTRRVNQLEDDVDERDRKIKDLERYIENLQKNHKHELSIEIHRHKETQKRLHNLENHTNSVENDLKEKEKILEIQNIYSQRIVRAPHHLGSSESTPLHFPSRRKIKTSNSADVGLTPREKAKLYEKKRRQEERQKAMNRAKRLAGDSMQNINESDNEVINHSQTESEAESFTREEERLEREREEEERRRSQLEMEERLRREEEERLLKKREEEERRAREEEERQELEERRRREEERRRIEEEEEAAARRRKEFEELQVRENEERKKKDALLAKLKSMDGGGDAQTFGNVPKDDDKDDFFLPKKSPEPVKRQTFAAPKHQLEDDEDESIPEIPTLDLATGQQTSGRQPKQQTVQPLSLQPQTVQPLSTNNAGGRNSSSTIHSSASSSSKKQYNFREQIENMHAGKPAYDDVSVPYLEKQRRESINSANNTDDDPNRIAVYGRRGSNRKPPPGPSSVKPASVDKPDRESQLMAELFGNSSNATGYQPSVLGGSRDASPVGLRGANKPKPVENTSLPWEIEESGDRMLPRRTSQPRNSLYSRRQASPPGVIDDIEELAL